MRVDSAPSRRHLEAMLRGVVIDEVLVAPMEVSTLQRQRSAGEEGVSHWLRVVVAEGKKHEVWGAMRRFGYMHCWISRFNSQSVVLRTFLALTSRSRTRVCSIRGESAAHEARCTAATCHQPAAPHSCGAPRPQSDAAGGAPRVDSRLLLVSCAGQQMLLWNAGAWRQLAEKQAQQRRAAAAAPRTYRDGRPRRLPKLRGLARQRQYSTASFPNVFPLEPGEAEALGVRNAADEAGPRRKDIQAPESFRIGYSAAVRAALIAALPAPDAALGSSEQPAVADEGANSLVLPEFFDSEGRLRSEEAIGSIRQRLDEERQAAAAAAAAAAEERRAAAQLAAASRVIPELSCLEDSAAQVLPAAVGGLRGPAACCLGSAVTAAGHASLHGGRFSLHH